MGLPDFPLDASLGSHFFHNVTSMNVGYYSVPHKNKEHFVELDVLADQQLIKATQYIKHVRFKEDLKILMDGKERTAVILYQ